ncbi:hypothetical protein ACFX15_030628 [Malus domestica]
MRYNLSASSLVDMPVVQYPVGSLLATLAPSSSSSDLRPRSESYPERPVVPNCVYDMRTGFCGYGGRCRYNHPRDRAAGENECSYYLKTGQCKFGITCKFHHPQPAGTTIPASAPQFYPSVQSPVPLAEQYGGASTSLRVARPSLLTGSYVQGTYGPVLIPPPGVVPIQGWSPYSAPLSPVPSPGAQPTVGATSLYGVTQLSSPTHGLASPYTSIPSSVGPSSSNLSEQVFPGRPGELECQYYLKTGDCKYGPSCRYHHPRDQTIPRITCLLSPMGLPLCPVCKVVLYYFC